METDGKAKPFEGLVHDLKGRFGLADAVVDANKIVSILFFVNFNCL